MKCIDLFAGAGGLSEGFRRQGFNIIAHVEKDYAASLTLKTREAFWYLKESNNLDKYIQYISGKISRDELYSFIPENVLNRVINEGISDETIESIFSNINEKLNGDFVDIIIGGPPCQAYSVVGRSRDPNRMENDPRNYLYKQYLKFIENYKPNIFIFENVLGLLSAKKGEIFKNIKSDMKLLDYNIDYRILDSQDFGVVQSRKRVILIGWKKELDFKYPNFENENENVQFTIKDLFYDLPPLQSGESINYGNYKLETNNCLKSLKIRGEEWNHLTQHISRRNNENDLEIYKICAESWNKHNKQLKYTELPEKNRTQKNIKSFLDRFKVVPYEDVSHTVVAHISKDGHYYIHPDINQNRSISVREAARIQSFPDDYYFESSRTAAFRQIGNAVPPLMAEKIAWRIKEALNK